MKSSFDGLEISTVSKKKTHGSGGFDLFHDDDDILSDYDCCFDLKDEELNLQEDYLHKLKVQRQRMERLSKSYHEKEQQLEKEMQRNGQFLCEIERLTSFLPYKEKYDNLQQNYDQLLLKYQLSQNQLSDVKEELAQVIYENSQTVSRLKGELKSCKQSSNMNMNQLEECLGEKHDEVKKIRKEWKQKEDNLNDQIKNLKNTVNKLKNELDQQCKIFEREKDKWAYELKVRDATIMEYEKSLENSKRQNIELKNDVLRYSDEVKNRENELAGLCSKFKNQLHQAKKTIHDKENILEQTQSELKKTQSDSYGLQGELEDMKIEFKKACQLYENTNKKLKYDSDSEILRLQSFVKELKDSIEELMEVKNHLIMENRKLGSVLKKKQQQQKHRKQMLKTELKEINRIEQVIDKIH